MVHCGKVCVRVREGHGKAPLPRGGREKEMKLILSKLIDIPCHVLFFLTQILKWEEELDGEHATPALEGGCFLQGSLVLGSPN